MMGIAFQQKKQWTVSRGNKPDSKHMSIDKINIIFFSLTCRKSRNVGKERKKTNMKKHSYDENERMRENWKLL